MSDDMAMLFTLLIVSGAFNIVQAVIYQRHSWTTIRALRQCLELTEENQRLRKLLEEHYIDPE